MTLTSVASFDVVNQTQTITFFESSTQVDEITYSAGSITFANISGFNLSKSDCLLYFQYLNAYFNSLLINFPSISLSQNGKWPLSQFDITQSSQGVTHIIYTQTSQGNVVYTTNYVPVALSASYIARSNPVTITLQEFYMTINVMTAFTNQISLN